MKSLACTLSKRASAIDAGIQDKIPGRKKAKVSRKPADKCLVARHGTWQPVKAKGKLVEAHANSIHGKDAVQKIFPARGTQGKSSLW
jgi:hypothetical protein